MKPSPSFAFLRLSVLTLLGLAASAFGQGTDAVTPNLTKISPGYARMPNVNINNVQLPSSSIRLVMPGSASSTRGLLVNDANSSGTRGFSRSRAASQPGGEDNRGPKITGLDTVPTFAGAFFNPNPSILDPIPNGVFPFIMIGNDPKLGGTTTIPAKMTAVSLRLLNPNGTVFATVPFAPFEDLTEDSPNFRDANYTVGRTQFGDAIQRAEFFNHMEENWHTLLRPKFVNRATLTIPATIQIQFQDGVIKTVKTYQTRTAADGSTVVFLLDLLFNFLDFNLSVDDINAGNFTTDAMNLHVYPNTFLFSIVDEQLDTACCVLGFHEYIFDPTVTPQPRWIFAFASWISPGTFGGGFQDITALSHEISEAFNDPFGNTIVPTWQFPGVPANDNVDCQANLETGDPVEVLSPATVPITTRERREVFTYHPQTEALLQWFEMGATSDAIGGAFSYPNTTLLPHSALPCPM